VQVVQGHKPFLDDRRSYSPSELLPRHNKNVTTVNRLRCSLPQSNLHAYEGYFFPDIEVQESIAMNRNDGYIYRFSSKVVDGNGEMRAELGGKGAGLAEMATLSIPVPPGFTISTSACRFYLEQGRVPPSLKEEFATSLKWLETTHGRSLNDEKNPLLVSVRSGAEVSMPGMMDTILNVGLNELNLNGLATQNGSMRFALDSYRRLLQMFGSVVLEVPKKKFDCVIDSIKEKEGVSADSEISEYGLRNIVDEFHEVILHCSGEPFPEDPHVQLSKAIEAVFGSWRNERAQHYRRLHQISETAGTAVTVQAMAFGNRGLDSGTGVGFTRNPSTGAKELFGEFLANAQGEDIVAGIRTPVSLSELGRSMPDVYEQLRSITSRLEKHFRDTQDFEFTIENGKLFLLQARSAKRSALASVRIAVDMAKEGTISRQEALARVKAANITEILSPQFDFSKGTPQVIAQGIAASPGAAVGRIALSADEAVEMAGDGSESPVILVTAETKADDIHGMAVATGFLTAQGGATSHAAVVARGMGKCCVTGAKDISVDETKGVVRMGGTVLRQGAWLSLDGSTGRVFEGRLPLRPADTNCAELDTLLEWAADLSTTVVRANADTPADAIGARKFGARGIGLCRTEHMFFAPDRLPHMRAMILASSREDRNAALERLVPIQQEDFEALFREMSPLPVTIRLLDPPLHEFLPRIEELNAELRLAENREDHGKVEELGELLQRVQALAEANPMMGHRGCRLSITYPEILEMQVTAILQAALKVQGEGFVPVPEIMVPLVACAAEVRHLRQLIDQTAAKVFLMQNKKIDYSFGTMIELPRAAVCAGSFADQVSFVSFGTNDLTQMTFGFSRDDARKYLDSYIEQNILAVDPFITVDQEGVGTLIETAIRQLRARNPKIKIGVCGEHGGDPDSITFFKSIGVDYVSCSPARLPVARLAVAQAEAAH
jgi:pyruvate,orthophosphate dikinase